MASSHEQLARLLHAEPVVLSDLERAMNRISGQEGVLDDIVAQNDRAVGVLLERLGLTRDGSAAAVRAAMLDHLRQLDQRLFVLLGSPDLSMLSHTCGRICGHALQLFTPPKGLFIKREKGVQMLALHPPQNILEHFGYADVRELVDREGFAPVMAALRFTQTTEWMHEFFDVAYSNLTPDDFEERDVELMVLNIKWLAVAEKFIAHKHHNVSHLKEFGVIFVTPIPLEAPGETMRMFILILHYLHEVPFYAALFRRHLGSADFATVFKSLLRGDVPTGPLPSGDPRGSVWRIVQRYLAKDDAADPRLFEPHVNPEADHWWRAQQDLGRLSRVLGPDATGFDLGAWVGLDVAGYAFTDAVTGTQEVLSFDLVDLVMSLVQKGDTAFTYHQQEALWNKIFIEYMGRERMDALIQENLVSGYISLS